jgi:hypothetical protein
MELLVEPVEHLLARHAGVHLPLVRLDTFWIDRAEAPIAVVRLPVRDRPDETADCSLAFHRYLPVDAGRATVSALGEVGNDGLDVLGNGMITNCGWCGCWLRH